MELGIAFSNKKGSFLDFYKILEVSDYFGTVSPFLSLCAGGMYLLVVLVLTHRDLLGMAQSM